MENNSSSTVIDKIWTAVSDVQNYIISFLSPIDLLKFTLVCKDFKQFLDNKGLRKLLDKLFKKYDLEYFPQNVPWTQLPEKYDKIDNSIRNGYAVVNCIATPTRPDNNIEDHIDAVSSNEDYIALGWTVTEGMGSGAFDTIVNSAVINIGHRNPIKTADGPRTLRIIGNALAEQEYIYYYAEQFGYSTPVELRSITGKEEQPVYHLNARVKTLGIVANRDPSMKHLVAIVAIIVKSDSLLDRSDLEIVIFDTKQFKEVTKIVLVDAAEPQMYSKPSPVVFKGNKVYYSENIHPVAETTLHIVDWTKNNEHTKMILPGTWSDIYGVHKSLVYGTTTKQWNDRYIFVYDMKTGRYLERKKIEHYYRSMFDIIGGYLVCSEDAMIHFIDYRSDKLDIVSSLMVTDRFSNHFKVRLDGTLLLAMKRGTVQLLDFENTCDVIEVMQMTGVNGEMKTLSFPAHELSDRMSAIFGDDFVSRYYKLKKDYRCGIIYRREQTGPQLPLSQKYFKHRAQYNTPYRYHKSGPGLQKYNMLETLPKHTEVGLFDTVVFFYEKWDGQRFKLAKPQDWAKLLLK